MNDLILSDDAAFDTGITPALVVGYLPKVA